jgi:ABC-type sugar transport system substrate-binding protein
VAALPELSVRLTRLVAAPLALGWLLSACAPPARPSVERFEPPAAPTVAQPARPTPRPHLTIGFSAPDPSQDPWRSQLYGARDEALELGHEVSAPELGTGTVAERQAHQVRELVRRKVDLLLYGGDSAPPLEAALAQAAAAGIPIAGLASGAGLERQVFRLGPDRAAQGRLAAECIGGAIGGRGQVALLAGPAGSVSAIEQANGLRDTLARRFPNTVVVEERQAPAERETAATLLASWLAVRPALSAVLATAEPLALGSLDALSAAGRLGRVKVASIGLSSLGEPSLRDGGMTCAVLQQAVAEGRAALRNAVSLLQGQPFERTLKSPSVLATRDNLDQLDWAAIRAPAR